MYECVFMAINPIYHTKPHINLMVALEEMSGIIHLDLSSGYHECLHKIAWQSICLMISLDKWKTLPAGGAK